jgi:hypothetical protein
MRHRGDKAGAKNQQQHDARLRDALGEQYVVPGARYAAGEASIKVDCGVDVDAGRVRVEGASGRARSAFEEIGRVEDRSDKPNVGRSGRNVGGTVSAYRAACERQPDLVNAKTGIRRRHVKPYEHLHLTAVIPEASVCAETAAKAESVPSAYCNPRYVDSRQGHGGGATDCAYEGAEVGEELSP